MGQAQTDKVPRETARISAISAVSRYGGRVMVPGGRDVRWNDASASAKLRIGSHPVRSHDEK